MDLDTPPSTPQVHLANRALAIDVTPEAAFVERAERYLGAPTESTTRADAKADLDAWVRQNTGGLIDKSAVTVTPDISVVLQDALLFSAAWQTPFGNQVSIPFAGAGEVDGVNEVLTVPFAETDRWSAVRLPYGGPFAADVILPKEGVDALTTDDLAAANTALGTAEAQRVAVTMPVVDLASTVDLGAALPGIDLSDLGGIVPGGSAPTWMQQTVLKVTAQGTVGAAVTEIPVAGSAPNEDKPLAFLVDRPYVMRVLDTTTSVPLLIASILTPGK
nr:serpin family protein [Tessaracoccus aquimaris]